eukprot:Pgem_evm1s20131
MMKFPIISLCVLAAIVKTTIAVGLEPFLKLENHDLETQSLSSKAKSFFSMNYYDYFSHVTFFADTQSTESQTLFRTLSRNDPDPSFLFPTYPLSTSYYSTDFYLPKDKSENVNNALSYIYAPKVENIDDDAITTHSLPLLLISEVLIYKFDEVLEAEELLETLSSLVNKVASQVEVNNGFFSTKKTKFQNIHLIFPGQHRDLEEMKEKYLVTEDQKNKPGYNSIERRNIREVFKSINVWFIPELKSFRQRQLEKIRSEYHQNIIDLRACIEKQTSSKKALRFHGNNYLDLIQKIFKAMKSGNVNTQIVQNYLRPLSEPPNKMMITRNSQVSTALSLDSNSKLKFEKEAESFFKSQNRRFSSVAFFGEESIGKLDLLSYLSIGEPFLNTQRLYQNDHSINFVKGWQNIKSTTNDMVYFNCPFNKKGRDHGFDYAKMILPIAATSEILIYYFEDFKAPHIINSLLEIAKISKSVGNRKFGHLQVVFRTSLAAPRSHFTK